MKLKIPHPGFKAVQESIAKKSGESMKNAARSRSASPMAKKKNSLLNKVKG